MIQKLVGVHEWLKSKIKLSGKFAEAVAFVRAYETSNTKGKKWFMFFQIPLYSLPFKFYLYTHLFKTLFPNYYIDNLTNRNSKKKVFLFVSPFLLLFY